MDYRKDVESLLDSYCRGKIAEANTVDERYAALWQEIRRYLASGGKRMRPHLVLFAHEAYKGGSADEGAISVAAAWELLHACLLVHDDIIDRDTLRHGQPNIAGRYQAVYGRLSPSDAPHYALSTALLGGDLLLMGAYELVTTASLSDSDKLLAHSHFNRALFAVAGGELIDTDSALYPINQSNPLSVAKHKTASYSLQLPLECGAALAGASEEELEKLRAIGLDAGIAYQMRDDVLGVFGDSATTGKSNRSDIVEKKRTFLIQKTIELSDDSQAERLVSLFAPDREVTEVEAEEVVDLIVSSGAKKAVEDAIEQRSRQAIDIIKTLHIDDRHKEHLSATVAKLVTRTH